jgi:hypothetical protein
MNSPAEGHQWNFQREGSMDRIVSTPAIFLLFIAAP